MYVTSFATICISLLYYQKTKNLQQNKIKIKIKKLTNIIHYNGKNSPTKSCIIGTFALKSKRSQKPSKRVTNIGEQKVF